MNLPQQFIKNIYHSFGERGKQWLDELPVLIEAASAQWGLSEITPVSNLSYNFVAFAKRENENCILKIGVPNPELKSEIAALKFFNGRGAVRLIESDDTRSMFLLERLFTGKVLSETGDDARATEIAAYVMRNLHQLAPQKHEFIYLKDWFDNIEIRQKYKGGLGPFPKKYAEIAETYIRELFAEPTPQVVLHGDCHHFNVLQAGEDWKIIDPKGLIGEAGYEVAPFLINPYDKFLQYENPVQTTAHRIAIFSEHLGIERQRLKMWGVAHCLLSAWWDLTEDDTGWEYGMACAEVIEMV
jgi:streptomycin 6-kinase